MSATGLVQKQVAVECAQQQAAQHEGEQSASLPGTGEARSDAGVREHRFLRGRQSWHQRRTSNGDGAGWGAVRTSPQRRPRGTLVRSRALRGFAWRSAGRQPVSRMTARRPAGIQAGQFRGPA